MRDAVEPASVAATRAAVEDNEVSVNVTRCDLRQGGPWAPTVLANLVRPLLLAVAAGLQRAPEQLVVSGLETGEADEVVAAFAPHGLREAARAEGDGWVAVRLA